MTTRTLAVSVTRGAWYGVSCNTRQARANWVTRGRVLNLELRTRPTRVVDFAAMAERPGAVTELLIAWSDGDTQALEALIPIVHAELHRAARRYLAREGAGHVLQPTALVNEAYLKLIDQHVRWQNRAQFFGVAAQLMRRVLLDYARQRKRLKRGGGGNAISISLDGIAGEQSAVDRLDVIALDRSLSGLAELDPERGRLVELRFFGGLTLEEAAEAMQLSPSTVKRMWRSSRAWLYRDLTRGADA